MIALVAENRPVGRPKTKVVRMVTVKISEDALEAIKLTANELGEKIGDYLSRIAKERALADFAEAEKLNAERKAARIKQLKEGEES